MDFPVDRVKIFVVNTVQDLVLIFHHDRSAQLDVGLVPQGGELRLSVVGVVSRVGLPVLEVLEIATTVDLHRVLNEAVDHLFEVLLGTVSVTPVGVGLGKTKQVQLGQVLLFHLNEVLFD